MNKKEQEHISSIERLLALLDVWKAILIYIILVVIACILIKPWNKYDGWEFARLAANVASGKGIVFFQSADGTYISSARMPPAYWALMALVFKLFGIKTKLSYMVLNVIQAIGGAAGVYLAYMVAKETYGEKAGRIAASILAMFPAYVFFAVIYHSVVFTTPMLIALVLLGNRFCKSQNLRYAIYSGVLLGAYWYFRSETLLLILLVAAAFYLVSNPGIKLKSAIYVIAISTLLASPYIARNSILFGRFYPTMSVGASQNLYMAFSKHATGSAYSYVDAEGNLLPKWDFSEINKQVAKLPADDKFELRRDAVFKRIALHDLKNSSVSHQIELLGKRLLYFLFFDPNHPKDKSPLAFIPWILLLASTTIAIILQRRNLGCTHLFMAAPILLQVAIIVFLSVPLPRFRLQFVPYLAIITAGFISELMNRSPQRREP